MNLITKSDVLLIAFQRPVSEMKIPDALIAAIQLRYIRPILQEDFYNAVVAVPTSYTAVVDLIKPIIAYYVKFHILPEIYADVSNTGVNRIPGMNRNSGDMDDLGVVRQATLDLAMMFTKALTQYLHDNLSSYPLYYESANAENTVQIAGGIIDRVDFYDDDFYNETDN